MAYTYQYARPMVTVDIILINNNTKILLINRLNQPFANTWALPGGFVDKDEDLITAAIRELNEETNISDIALTQFKAYGKPHRDPRGHTISIVFFAKTNQIPTTCQAADDAKDLKWFDINELPKLAFDHEQIIHDFVAEYL